MKIINWNVGRLHYDSAENIKRSIQKYDADIIVLTETSEELDFNENYIKIKTKSLDKGFDGIDYKNHENRTTIWTKYKVVEQRKTFDKHTALQVILETEYGKLNLYAGIIGVFGGKGERFKTDLNRFLDDFKRFDEKEINCVIGDFNVTFSGYTYPSHEAQNKLKGAFEKMRMKILTKEIDNNVEHIAISNRFLENKKISIESWNLDKKSSDHIGIYTNITL